jgi:hypothetical protein
MRRIQVQTRTSQLLITHINQGTNHLVSQIFRKGVRFLLGSLIKLNYISINSDYMMHILVGTPKVVSRSFPKGLWKQRKGGRVLLYPLLQPLQLSLEGGEGRSESSFNHILSPSHFLSCACTNPASSVTDVALEASGGPWGRRGRRAWQSRRR